MSTAPLPMPAAILLVSRLVRAAVAARAVIAVDRKIVHHRIVGGAAGQYSEAGAELVATYDRVLAQLDAALAPAIEVAP